VTLYQIGVVQNALCEVDESISALRRQSSIQIDLLEGITWRLCVQDARLVICLYEAESDSSLAEFNDILATQLRIHGEKHPNVAETLHSIGCSQEKGTPPKRFVR
jgi:hypothetical protein